MRVLSSAVTSALAGGRVVIAQLVFMDLSEPVYLNTSGVDVDWDGKTWRGAAGIGRIGEVIDSPGEIKALNFELSAVMSDQIALALAEPIQGKRVEIRTAIFDPDTLQVLDAPLEWAGLLDVPRLVDTPQGTVMNVSAEHLGVDLLRPNVVRYSDVDQQRLYPGDRGLEYMVDQTEQAIVWPAASFYRK